MISNPVWGGKEDAEMWIQPIDKRMLSNMMRMQMKGDFRDF